MARPTRFAGALGYALQSHNKTQSGQELLSTQNRWSAEGLVGLPNPDSISAQGK